MTPRTFRPVAVSLIMWLSTAILVLMMVVVGRALPPEVEFTALQIGTLWAIVAVVVLLAFAVSRSRVHADEQGLVVVNGFRRRRVPWSAIAAISMREGSPWPVLVTHDDERIILFAIQGSDGRSAREAVFWLREQLP